MNPAPKHTPSAPARRRPSRVSLDPRAVAGHHIEETIMRRHDWRREIIRATRGAAIETYHHLRYVQARCIDPLDGGTIQQLVDGHCGLSIRLPRAYNLADAMAAREMATRDLGIPSV